jgi:AcrR family transcriptional regulator
VSTSAEGDRPLGRRAEYAEMTRQAIVAAARTLFVQQGYFGTTVEDIAKAARVSPATVYAVGRGKQGLLRTVIESGTSAPAVAEFYARLDALDDPDAVLELITSATRMLFEEWSDLMRVVTATAPHDAGAAKSLAVARRSQRGGFTRTAQRLSELGALREGIETEDAVEILWFFLSNSAYFTLVDDNEWSLDKAQAWLRENLRTALF